MKTIKRNLSIILCSFSLGCLLFGCGANNGSKSISVNMLNSSMSLKKVTYYDFFYNKVVSSYTGKMHVLDGFNGTTMTVTDQSGKTRVFSISKKLSSRPKSIKIYTNRNKTTGDTYSCTY